MRVTFTWDGGPDDSIYNVLKATLGREPTHAELCDKVKSILAEARMKRDAGWRRPEPHDDHVILRNTRMDRAATEALISADAVNSADEYAN